MKKVFSYNADIEKNAYMNWRTNKYEAIHNMNVVAGGFIDGASVLIQECLEDNWDKKADILIFPILFSINHSIEVYTKSICWSLNILLGNNSKFRENHDIRGIWLTAKQKIKKFGFGVGREEVDFKNMIITTDKYIDEIFNVINNEDINKAYYNIDFSRYPINNRWENHFYINSLDNVTIDLENLKLIVEDIKQCLDSLSGYYYQLVLEKQEQETLD